MAIETSDVVLMNCDAVCRMLKLTKATARNMKQNIFIAVGVVLYRWQACCSANG